MAAVPPPPTPAAVVVMPRPGDVVAGKYLIVRAIGEGGMGVVYEATHQRLRQRVALKLLLPGMLEHEVILSRFEREARAAARLRGRHVARVVDVDVTPEGLPYMVMDFLEGHDLQVEIERLGRLSIESAVDFVLQACAAMVEAHQIGIVHRDLKPSNLFLARDDATNGIVKVLDFGISKVSAAGEVKLTEADAIMGTALYMSPEQLRASHAVDARTDIWALGVILYEALTGRVPFLGPPQQVAAQIVSEDVPDVRHLRGEIAPGLAAVIARTLQRDPEARFPDVRALAIALAPFALPSSIGRNFAESIGAGSAPRISAPELAGRTVGVEQASGAPDSSSQLRGVHDDRTSIHARGVAEDRMQIASGASRPEGWREPPPSKRAQLALGLLFAFAFAFTLLAVGAVLLVLRRRPTVATAAVSGSTTALAPASAASPSPPGEISGATPREAPPPPVMTSPPVAGSPSFPSAAPSSPPKPKASNNSTARPRPVAAPSAKPVDDKPLFL